ncbi:MAG TPA: hypothetical protein GXX57_10450 [Firmicutes bacterium]|nr:hypothetical protein [Bacillota bacterium]
MPWENVVIMGVAWGPLVSVVISILKGWLKVESKYIQPINWVLGFLGLVLYNILGGETWYMAILAGLTAVMSSTGFHETFGHMAKYTVEKLSL